MNEYVEQARIVITHGGPASFIMPLQIGKTPIVVPRQKKYDEHVNDHQADFSKAVEERMKNIIVVEDVNELADTINNYEDLIKKMSQEMSSNNLSFNAQLENISNELLGENK